MSAPAIRAENLGKLYRVGQLDPYKTLRETVMNVASAPFHAVASAFHKGKPRGDGSPSSNTIWALKDVSFEIEPGEAMGIIGSNGAGKTTLLKILTRVTTPTVGLAELHGRVGSLLEVGIGLHPELTGRENIFLSGAVLGMKRAEIRRKFSEIVEFSGVEKFLDTPMKRYSSGMQVRLAFSVAAHLDLEILLVDEVLAVGDAEFQKKCLGKMGDVAKGGRTVLFVSHNMGAVQNLCEKCMLIEDGGIRNMGKASDIIDEYLNVSAEIFDIPLAERKEQRSSGFKFLGMEFLNSQGQKTDILSSGEDITIALDYQCEDNNRLSNVQIVYYIMTKMGEEFTRLDTQYYQNFETVPPRGRILCSVPRLPLMPGDYSIYIKSYSNGIMTNELPDAGAFYVKEGAFFRSGLMPKEHQAKFLVDHHWGLEGE